LLTDVIMPGMHGAALSAELTRARARLRTLFVSGFPEDSIVRHGVLKDDVAYLPKPFSAAALGHAVRAVLDRHA
jgi:FixJ family two-component response regulator